MENELYKIECEDINNILNKIKNKPLNNEEITTLNDNKYRELRKKLMQQNKHIEALESKIKILENIIKNSWITIHMPHQLSISWLIFT